MNDTASKRWFVRQWPLIVAITAWILVAQVPAFFRSEIIRGALAVGCLGLMVYQWSLYRKMASGANLSFLSLIAAGFALASIWLGLNVARFYTYDPENAYTWAWHLGMARVQTVVAYALLLVVALVAVWMIFLIISWLNRRRHSLSSQ